MNPSVTAECPDLVESAGIDEFISMYFVYGREICRTDEFGRVCGVYY